VVFAMANPEPEVRVEAVGGNVAIMATGRSDYPKWAIHFRPPTVVACWRG